MRRPSGLASRDVGILIGVAVIVLVISLSGLFAPAHLNSNDGVPPFPPSVSIMGNVTVVGRAAGIPCGALRLPCPLYTNESTISALLIRYDGIYYYVSYIRVNNIQYMIWYDNSTYYCVTPRVSWANACPTN